MVALLLRNGSVRTGLMHTTSEFSMIQRFEWPVVHIVLSDDALPVAISLLTLPRAMP